MSGCAGCAFKGLSTAIEDSFVGVRFREETNLTLCRTDGQRLSVGQPVVVELESGPALGTIRRSPMPIFKPCQKANALKILRCATEEDVLARERQLENEMNGKLYCRERSRSLGLEMKVSRVDFSLNGKRAMFYFTANGRVDFRQLVRDLSRRFSTRVRMIQVGARDEAGLLGGIGICGKTLCCSTWLQEFRPISIQMAKRQNLSLNPSKISGQCGRLLCCLAYEDDRYQSPSRDPKRSVKPERPDKPGSTAKTTRSNNPSAQSTSKNPVKWRTAN